MWLTCVSNDQALRSAKAGKRKYAILRSTRNDSQGSDDDEAGRRCRRRIRSSDFRRNCCILRHKLRHYCVHVWARERDSDDGHLPPRFLELLCTRRKLLNEQTDAATANVGLRQIGLAPTSVDQDDCSVISDISGLTGMFDKCRIDRKRDKAPSLPSTRSLSSIPASIFSPMSIISSASSGQREKKCSRNSSVRFGNVHVRHNERIMSDNPACRSGPGMDIGWKYDKNEVKVTVDDWEANRSRVRTSVVGAVSRSSREELLRGLGYSNRDIAATCRELNKLRARRRQASNNVAFEQLEMIFENATRSFRKIVFSPVRIKA